MLWFARGNLFAVYKCCRADFGIKSHKMKELLILERFSNDRRLRLPRLVIGLKISRQFFNQWETKPKPIVPWFLPSFEKVTVNCFNFDWFIALLSPVIIGQSNRPFAANDHVVQKSSMLESKLIIISALGHQNKGKSSFTGSGLFVLMSQCGNNNELALQHGGFCTTWSLAAKGLFGIGFFTAQMQTLW